MKVCTVLLTNDKYFEKMLYTLDRILHYGYNNDICIVVGDDLCNSNKLNHPLLQHSRIIIKYFPDISFSETFLYKFKTITREAHWRDKIFQYHKFYLFNTFFKQWDFIFYIDAGTNVYSSIEPIINSYVPNKFLAHSDAYPSYEWKLRIQFIEDSLFADLEQEYNLNVDYPQTTIMLYDTNLINDDTFNVLISLSERYPISKTNDQGIIALYVTNIKKCWEQIKLGDDNTWYYDYIRRLDKSNKPYILLKS
jgi:hypothetical protein